MTDPSAKPELKPSLSLYFVIGAVDWSNLDLSGCDLTGIDLSGASLVMATLNDTDLSKSNLTGADLTGAQLRNHNPNSDLIGNAELSRVTALSRVQLMYTVLTLHLTLT